MGSKGKKQHRNKDRKSRLEKKHKKEKKTKHTKRRDNSDSSSSSDSAEVHVDVNTQLAKSRAAVKATREILAYNYQLRSELRELVRQLDGGGALDVTGISDEFLRRKLCILFDNLVQLRKNSAGQYFKQKSAEPVLSFIAPLLEEAPASVAAYAPPFAGSVCPAAAATGTEPGKPAAVVQCQEDRDHVEAETEADEPVGLDRDSQQQEAGQEVEAGKSNRAGVAMDGVPIGPQAGPLPGPQRPAEGLIESESEEGDVCPSTKDGGGGEGGAAAALGAVGGQEGRRVLGPSLPTQQQRDEAAQMEYQASEPEEEDSFDDLLVGPPPPELEEEMNAASMDERSAEVVRVTKVLQRHTAALEGSTAAQAAEQPPDPYEVLGVPEEATSADVKKRYWRLSLLIHPDKCDHPEAHDAFQAVSTAAKELQDTGLRMAVDNRRQERRLRAEFEAEAAAAERQRQWRILRGEATAADLAGPSTAQFGGPTREAWMTELPPERKAGGSQPSMATQIGFSKAGVKGRGDTSEWTLTPAQRAAQLEGGQGVGQGPMLLTAAAEGPAQQRLKKTAAAIDSYNSQRRNKSLLEQHLEKKEPHAKKRRKKEEAKEAEQDWDPTQHPWRPFDREKDLGPGLTGPANAQDLLKNAKALGSRFSGGQGSSQRTFL